MDWTDMRQCGDNGKDCTIVLAAADAGIRVVFGRRFRATRPHVRCRVPPLSHRCPQSTMV